VINLDLFDVEPVAQLKRDAERFPLFAVTLAFRDTDICDFV